MSGEKSRGAMAALVVQATITSGCRERRCEMDGCGHDSEIVVSGLVAFDPVGQEYKVSFLSVVSVNGEKGGELNARETDAANGELVLAAEEAGVGLCIGCTGNVAGFIAGTDRCDWRWADGADWLCRGCRGCVAAKAKGDANWLDARPIAAGVAA